MEEGEEEEEKEKEEQEQEKQYRGPGKTMQTCHLRTGEAKSGEL